VAGSGTSVFFSKLIWGTFHEMFSDCSNRTHFWDILRRQQNDIQQRHPKKLRKYAERAESSTQEIFFKDMHQWQDAVIQCFSQN